MCVCVCVCERENVCAYKQASCNRHGACCLWFRAVTYRSAFGQWLSGTFQGLARQWLACDRRRCPPSPVWVQGSGFRVCGLWLALERKARADSVPVPQQDFGVWVTWARAPALRIKLEFRIQCSRLEVWATFARASALSTAAWHCCKDQTWFERSGLGVRICGSAFSELVLFSGFNRLRGFRFRAQRVNVFCENFTRKTETSSDIVGYGV